MTRTVASVTIAVLLLATPPASATDECTAAVVGPQASAVHAPLLWKNRDTDTLSNKVVFVDEEPYDYLCLANFDADSGRSCWAGLNSAGFAIINTVAYNLPEKDGETSDLEGLIMADALRTCRTVGDFERYLDANQGPDLGALTNFAVIDREGHAVVLETHNHGYTALDATSSTAAMVVTNYARTGEEGAGAGYLRFERASRLFARFAPGAVDFRTILTRFSRDTGHVLLDNPDLDRLHDLPAEPEHWVFTGDCIDRSDTSTAVVVVGARADDPASTATLWVIPGEPLTAVAVPLWVESGRSPEPLWKGEKAPLWEEAMRIKRLLRPRTVGHGEDYAQVTVLDNASGTGYLPGLLAAEERILERTLDFLAQPRNPEERAAFQDEMASTALAAMRAVR